MLWGLMLLTGCSAVKLTYGQAPTLAYWWLDGYVDISHEQAPRVRSALDEFFAWHRATQLGDYAGLLAGAQRQAVDNITPAQVCRLIDEAEQRLSIAYDHAVPAMADVLRGFSLAQVTHLEQRYDKGNDEWARDHLQGSATERREATAKRWVDRAETLYGSLDDAQRRLIGDGLAALPYEPQRWLAERRARQQDITRTLRQLLSEKADASQLQAALRAFASHQARSPRADYRAYRQRLDEANCQLLARIHNATTPAQRRKAVERLKGWEDDLRTLAREAAPVRSSLPSAAG